MKKRYIILILALVAMFGYFCLIPALVLSEGKKQIFIAGSDMPTSSVAIVFGAGIRRDGTPKDMLKDRLLTASALYKEGKVKKILVSGDNRFVEYNEPDVMYTFLSEEEGVPETDIVRDYAGRSTYETCIRAKEIWDVKDAILISQGYHLPRAIFICRTLGIQSAGYSGTRQQYLGEVRFKTRELLAIHKAFLDVHLFHPPYVGGEKETDLSP